MWNFSIVIKPRNISPISLYKLSRRTICLQIYDRVDKCWILSANRQNPPISFQALVVFSSRFRVENNIYIGCTRLVGTREQMGKSEDKIEDKIER